MTSSSEPTTVGATSWVVACPHCGGPVAVPLPDVKEERRPEAARAVGGAGLPEAGSVRRPVGRVLKLVFEVIDGRRAAEQLTEVLTPSVLRYVRVHRLSGRPGRVSRLLSLRVCRPTEDAVEAAAVVALGSRVRAVAARLERTPTGWRCVVLRIL